MHPLLPANPWYGLIAMAGVVVSGYFWIRRHRAQPEMLVVYAAGLLAALVGAKLGYALAELPFDWGRPHLLTKLAVGKTILGALLGGYLGVEGGKRLVGHREATGDTFALLVPLGIAAGRVGCLTHGCCPGIACDPHWWALRDSTGTYHLPAPVFELAFNLAAFAALLWLHRTHRQRGQLFHLYLIAYGSFRLLHEPLRDTPRYDLPLNLVVTPYQLLAAAVLVLGLWRYLQRRRPGDVPSLRRLWPTQMRLSP